jgi:shikimate kinase
MTHPFNKIYLIGFMGSGKSTVGKKLALHLNWSFIDLDDKVELKAGMKIAEIFAEKGESFFRAMESEVLRSLSTEADTVISTGGGTPCFDENMDYMLESGLTIYLKMTPAQLKSRLLRSSHERPLIKNIRIDDLQGFIEEILGEREKWYSRAEIAFDRFNSDISDLLVLVRNWIKE